jgi:hypothetical protein
VTDEETHDGHEHLEQSEYDCNFDPGPGAHTGHADTDGPGKVREAKGEGDQQQGDHHVPSVSGWMRVSLAITEYPSQISEAARSPVVTAPSMKPWKSREVCSPAKWMFPSRTPSMPPKLVY